ncbi:MAG: hypothetical protein LBI39_01650 [Puniceicoccales bacterium]|nr:hypothetical protein [Puniceicoccales bacterium]
MDGIFRGKEQRGHLNASAGSARSQCAACLMRATSWGTYAEFLALMAALALLGFQTETASGAAVCLMAQRISKKRASSPKRICGAKNADQVISFLAASAQSSMIVLKLTFSLPAHPA